MQSNKLKAIIILALLVEVLCIFPALSALMDTVSIATTGRVTSQLTIVAKSGYWQDIQAAVDQIVAEGGVGTVYIPEGTFNFVNVSETWTGARVNVPAGISIKGEPTQRDSNNQVVEWKTILRLPSDVPGSWTTSIPTWFKFAGSGDPAMFSRFSDIKLVGYRSINSDSTTLQRAIRIDNVINFRVDHCAFEHTCGGGISIWGLNCNGVIDHCRIYNIYGWDVLAQYTQGNIGYGVDMGRGYNGVTFDPTMSVLGHYTTYTVFIEDCYFSKWRHCVSSGHGSHYVFRYNTIDQDYGHFSLDVHGLRDTEDGRAGGRAAEIYENTIINCNITDDNPNGPQDFSAIFQNGGGCGVWFNNYVDSSYVGYGITLYKEDYVPSETWHLKDFYLWSTKGTWNPSWNGVPSGFTADRNVLADWNRQAGNRFDANYPNVNPTWSIAGYKPYTYPHPLVIN